MAENICPHCVSVPMNSKVINQGLVKCGLVSANVLVPKDHFTQYCFNDYQKCIDEQKYEEWVNWVK